MGRICFLQINKIKCKAGDTNLGVFRTLMVSKARKLNQIIREWIQIEKKGGVWRLRYTVFQCLDDGLLGRKYKRDWDVTFRDEEGKWVVSWKPSEECVAVRWTDGLCEMVVKRKEIEDRGITTVFSNMEAVGELSIQWRGWGESLIWIVSKENKKRVIKSKKYRQGEEEFCSKRKWGPCWKQRWIKDF